MVLVQNGKLNLCVVRLLLAYFFKNIHAQMISYYISLIQPRIIISDCAIILHW